MNHGIFFLHLAALLVGFISNIFLYLSSIRSRRENALLYNLFWGNFTLLFLYNFLSSYGDVSGWSAASFQIPLSLIGIFLKYCLVVVSLNLFFRFPQVKAKRNLFIFSGIILVLIGGLLIISNILSMEFALFFRKANGISDILLLFSLSGFSASCFLPRKRKVLEDSLLKRTILVLLFSSLLSLIIWSSLSLFDINLYFWDISFAFLCFYGLWSLYLVIYLRRALFNSDIPSLDDLDDEMLNQRGITKREKEILQSLVKGMNRTEIAEKECISPRTVDNHIARIYRKFEVNERVELIRKLLNE